MCSHLWEYEYNLYVWYFTQSCNQMFIEKLMFLLFSTDWSPLPHLPQCPPSLPPPEVDWSMLIWKTCYYTRQWSQLPKHESHAIKAKMLPKWACHVPYLIPTCNQETSSGEGHWLWLSGHLLQALPHWSLTPGWLLESLNHSIGLPDISLTLGFLSKPTNTWVAWSLIICSHVNSRRIRYKIYSCMISWT